MRARDPPSPTRINVIMNNFSSRLQIEAENEMYDAVIHVGDFAYDMDSVSI